ncbi:hypothetical protein [Caballeronia calidae]|uniref:hypothetical protein n=1 Tax=Caballeronia calidae TaxID=1777139 RepID=UPI0012FE4B72|nr:hypothetical protein [Caballeronia calidae]
MNALKEAPVKPAPESAKSVEGETAASDVKHNGIAKHPRSPFPELALNYAAALMAEELPELFAPPQASCLGSTVAATQAQMRAAYKLENQFRSAPLPSTLKPRIKQRLAEWLEKERALLKKQRDLGKPKKPDADKPGALKADDTAALIRAQAKLRQAGEVNDPELKLRLLQVGALCHRNAHHGVNRGGVDWGSHRDAVGKAYEVAIRHAHALAKQRDKSVADDLLAQIQNDCKQLSIKP